MRPPLPRQPPRRPAGVALVCALMLTLVAGVLAAAVGRLALASLAAARAERDHAVARFAAEAALRDAERDVARDSGLEPASGTATGAGPPPPAPTGRVTYGERTGARMAVGDGLSPVRLPAYQIEVLPAGATDGKPLLRITAIGYGTRPVTRVVLQTLYRMRTNELPAGRTGWRELAHWPGEAPAPPDDEEDAP